MHGIKVLLKIDRQLIVNYLKTWMLSIRYVCTKTLRNCMFITNLLQIMSKENNDNWMRCKYGAVTYTCFCVLMCSHRVGLRIVCPTELFVGKMHKGHL